MSLLGNILQPHTFIWGDESAMDLFNLNTDPVEQAAMDNAAEAAYWEQQAGNAYTSITQNENAAKNWQILGLAMSAILVIMIIVLVYKKIKG